MTKYELVKELECELELLNRHSFDPVTQLTSHTLNLCITGQLYRIIERIKLIDNENT